MIIYDDDDDDDDAFRPKSIDDLNHESERVNI